MLSVSDLGPGWEASRSRPKKDKERILYLFSISGGINLLTNNVNRIAIGCP